jgi:hypothetical protein
MKKLLTVGLLSLSLMASSALADLLTAYKIGAATDVESAKTKLVDAGFEVVGTYKSDAGTTVLYTNAALKAMGDKENRGFASVGRILVNESQVNISNPLYFGKAFMQKEYNNDVSAATLASLEKAFGPLKDSEDKFEEKDLAGYHFMMGMPYYEDMDIVGEGTTADLVAKAKASKGVTAVVQLSADRYVAFVEMDKRTNGFVKKIGLHNGQLLPWAVLIEGGKAKAHSAKYFIAISYPLFTMTEFMTIATVPGAITKDLEKIFK